MTADRAERPVLQDGWQLPEGLQLLGPVKGSGIREPTYLLRRQDGQIVQVSELLHLVVSAVVPGRTAKQVADVVSGAYGRTLTTDGLAHLVKERLQPLGLVEHAGTAATSQLPRARPILSLSLKGTLVPARAVRMLARPLAPAFWPPVVAAALVGVVLLDARLFVQSNPLTALAASAGHSVAAAGALRLADPRRGSARDRSRRSLPLRRGKTRPDRVRRLPGLPGVLHRCHRLVPTRSGGTGAHRPRRPVLQRLVPAGQWCGLPVDGRGPVPPRRPACCSSRCSSSSSRPCASTATTCSRTSPASPTCSPGCDRSWGAWYQGAGRTRE